MPWQQMAPYTLLHIPSMELSELGGCGPVWQTELHLTPLFSPYRDLKPENILLDDHGGWGGHRGGVE